MQRPGSERQGRHSTTLPPTACAVVRRCGSCAACRRCSGLARGGCAPPHEQSGGSGRYYARDAAPPCGGVPPPCHSPWRRPIEVVSIHTAGYFEAAESVRRRACSHCAAPSTAPAGGPRGSGAEASWDRQDAAC